MLPPEVQKSKEGEGKKWMAAWRGTVRVTEMDFSQAPGQSAERSQMLRSKQKWRGFRNGEVSEVRRKGEPFTSECTSS